MIPAAAGAEGGAPPREPRPRFVVDGSLILLGKYLRCAGFDADWHAGVPLRELAARAEREGRVLITRSSRVDYEFARPRRCVRLAASDAGAQFRELAVELALDLRSPFTRCIRCNVELEPVDDPESIRARVEPGVFAAHRRFFTCPSCATVFWHGSHVANTCRKLGLEPPHAAQNG